MFIIFFLIEDILKTKLAYPGDYRVHEFLSNLIKLKKDDSNNTVYGYDEVWVGLDSRSVPLRGHPLSGQTDNWLDGDGGKVTEIRWASGEPDPDPDKQCVFMDNASGG